MKLKAKEHIIVKDGKEVKPGETFEVPKAVGEVYVNAGHATVVKDEEKKK